jgi:protease-4
VEKIFKQHKHNKIMKKQKSQTWIIILVLLGLFVFSVILAGIISTATGAGTMGNVVIIPIKGMITGDPIGGFFDTGTSSAEIVKDIEKAEKDSTVKAIIFEINSPGGSAVASDEIVQAIKDMEKPSVAWIREVGASGAYWAASATDHIIANRMSVTGSIGVRASYLEFSRFLEQYNITYQELTSGDYKETGSPFRNLTLSERILLQKKIDLMHDMFIESVAENRNMSVKEMEKLATGEFYLGAEGINNGLVDELGGKKEAIEYLEEKLDMKIKTKKYEKKKSFFDIIENVLNENSFYMGRGIANQLFQERFTIRT